MVLSLLHLVKMVVLVATDWELRKHKSCLILIQASLCRAVLLTQTGSQFPSLLRPSLLYHC